MIRFHRFGLSGAFLFLLPLTAAAQMLVVAENAEQRAALINPNDFSVLARLPTGKGPHEITISRDGRRAFIADSGTGPNGVRGNTITVLDLARRTVKATFNLGEFEQPHDTRVSRDGRWLWVACALARTILELDAESGKILKTYKIKQDGAWFLEATPDARKLYTANLEGKSVCVIDRTTGGVKTIPLDAAAWGIDITPDGKEVWVCSSVVNIIDTATDQITATLPVGGQGAYRIRFTADGRLAVISIEGRNQLALVDVKSRQRLATIELTTAPKVITISPDGRRAFLSNPADHQITVVDLVAHKQLTTFAVGKTPDGIAWAELRPSHNEHPAWSPDGRRIAFASNRDGNNEIYVMNADGSQPRRLTNAPGRDAHPAWSPDGKKIAFQSPRAGEGNDTNLYVMNADGSQQVRITNLKGFAGVPCWSPDGRQILFQWEDETRAEKRWHIYVVNADGSHLRPLTNDAANNQVPNWSPDGRRILFFSDLTGKNQLYLMNPDSTNKIRLTNNNADDHAAFWSRDGKRIVFISDRDGSREIYTMKADGSQPRRVTKGVTAFQASWSADGKRILFADVKNGNAQIFTINADGSERRQLTEGQNPPAVSRSSQIEEGYVPTDDGTRLFYQKVGRGAKTLILPGRLFAFENFKQLADRYTLIAYDMRGRGRSDAIPDEQKAAMLGIHHDVKDPERIRQHFKVNKASLIGYSYLGLMVVLYALEHPTRVERLVQLGPVPLRFETQYPDQLAAKDEPGDPQLRAELRRRRQDNFHLTHPQEYCELEWNHTRFGLVGNPANVHKLGGSLCALPNEWPTSLVKHFEHSFASVQKLDVPKSRIAQANIPVLIIHGVRDRNAAYGAGREWAMTLPNARLLTVKEAAHQVFAEYPEIVFPALRVFLQGRWPAPTEKVRALQP